MTERSSQSLRLLLLVTAALVGRGECGDGRGQGRRRGECGESGGLGCGRSSGYSREDRGCKGMLAPPCVCDSLSVECINGQFTTDEIFLNVGIHFNYLERVAFHGNNFNVLGGAHGHLFGPGVVHKRLRSLNLSANYIVQIHPEAFEGMPELRELDLSQNEILLKEPEALRLFRPLPKLQRLHMKKAFPRPADYDSNASSLQLEVLEAALREANLGRLSFVDLSWNFLRHVPFNFPCSLPALSHLSLKNNYLEAVSLNASCLSRLKTLDLSGNMFQSLNGGFRLMARSLPPFSLILQHNDFHCDCHSKSWIAWLRSSRAVQDRDALVCRLASPPTLAKAALATLPLEKLHCQTPLASQAFSFSHSLLVPFMASLLLHSVVRLDPSR